MNKEQQDKNWKRLSDNEQAKWREDYKFNVDNGNTESVKIIEDLFGSHNLQPKPKIRTWEDVEEYYTQVDIELDKATKSLWDYSHCFTRLLQKCIATLKIAKLIELGYGGMVTNEEWKDEDKSKWVINCDMSRETRFEILEMFVDKSFIAFHEESQAEEFLLYPENVELVKQYNLL